jgi:hypothetical protein
VTERWPVIHRCGHRLEWDLSKNHPGDRYGFARWLAGRDCTRCWWANRRDPYKQARAARIRLRQALGIQTWERQFRMPQLVGRPKAVAWARKIRHRLLTARSQISTPDALRRRDSVEAGARRITTAQWWIEHRKLDTAALAKALKDSLQRQTMRRASHRSPR